MVNDPGTELKNNGQRREWLRPALLLILVVYGLYFPTFGHEWTLDDFPVIVENSDIRSLGNLLENTYPGRPLREFTYWVDYSLFGFNPGPWHLQHLFWHGLNGVLLWLLVRRLGGGAVAAWTASLLFLVHPLQVEVVANLSHRKDSLALAFALAAMLAYIRAINGSHRRRWLLMAVTSYVLACLGKQNALLLPLGFVAYEYVSVEKSRRFLLAKPKILGWASVLAAFSAAAGFVLVNGFVQHKARIESFLVEMNRTPPFREVDYFQTVLKGWAFMGRRIVWPADLAPEYVFSAPASWFDPWIVCSLLAFAALVGALIWSRLRSPIVFFGLVWFLLFFLPISNIWPNNYFAADRYYYAPLSAVCLLAGVAFQRCWQHRKVLTSIGVLALIFALAYGAYRQSGIWRSPGTLWAHAVVVNPTSASALNNRGRVASASGDLQGALFWYTRAANANSSRPMPRHNLGWTYEKLGNRRLALYYFLQFLERVPYSSNPAHHRAAIKVRKHLQTEYGVTF